MRFSHFLLALPALLLFACSENLERYDQRDSPTSGKLKLICEEGLALQVRTQVYTFETFYPNAKVLVSEATELDAIEGLYKDSCKAIIIARDLSQEEKKSFAAANVNIVSHFIMKDAIALVAGKDFPDSLLQVNDLIRLLKGDTSSKNYKVVFDKPNSGNTRFLKDSLLQGAAFGKNCFAVETSPKLIETVSGSRDAIGVLDYAWLSDKDDPRTKALLDKVKIIPLSSEPGKEAFYPDQSNIATGDYPLTRPVYFIRRGGDFSLAAGFLSFVAGQKGQLMFLKSGLVPSRQEERVIEINTAPLGQ